MNKNKNHMILTTEWSNCKKFDSAGVDERGCYRCYSYLTLFKGLVG